MASKNYLRKLYPLAFMLLIAVQYSCKKMEGYNTVVSTDKTKPGPVTNVKITNLNGEAIITYDLPESSNILYVQATYKINDTASRQSKSSYYSDSIIVSGFAKSQDYDVILHVVSRADVKSDSVVVKVHPDTPPYLLTYATLFTQPTFGGVNIKAVNKTKSNIGIVTLFPNALTNRYEIIDQNYSNSDSVNYSLRGYDTLPKPFAFYVTDQYGNRSDTVFTTIKPIFEELMDKSKFQQYVLGTDVPNYQNGYFNLPKLFDGDASDNSTYATEQPLTTKNPLKPFLWPVWATFDMGQTAKLSRYVLNYRTGGNNEFVWTSGAPQQWIMWGRADTPQDELMPTDTTQLPPVGGMTPGGWINMGVFDGPPRPADNPLTNADITLWNAGFNFDLSFDLPPVRYIRFECLHIMGGTDNYFNMNEITFYGNTNIH
ncbi:hypothetical protein A9P82_02830 [Arachidicoccus ginsenosidimutans]|uniref:DUF4959 domain-containing protein n=1 Tax=Arachidicoccus sp. BS20 TaxID=1850526 RepID=UPI0007F11BF8|nr:DUF4959 domain-containing protein [Arachidicoccus sp. BS20]ANI88329.1 hypothetical protein A9P82_02830 [Arachidicoccus sp. BS20]